MTYFGGRAVGRADLHKGSPAVPSAIEFTFDHPAWMEVSPSKLHGLGYRLFAALLEARSSGTLNGGPEEGSPPPGNRVDSAPSATTATAHEPGPGAGEPFSVWPLASGAHQTRSRVRLNWLPDDADLAPLRSAEVIFGSVRCHVVHAAVRTRTFAELLDAPAVDVLRFRFRSPATFARRGRTWPVPDPILVLGSLARRWNAHARVALPAVALSELLDRVEVDDLDTQLRSGWARGPGIVPGFVGHMDLRMAKAAGHGARSLLSTLGAAAEFLSMGKQTTYGYGAVTGEPMVARR